MAEVGSDYDIALLRLAKALLDDASLKTVIAAALKGSDLFHETAAREDSTLLAAALALMSTAFAVDSFQVTGVISEVTDAKITVLKGAAKERFEIARTADTKVTGDLKVGGKVTIAYTMTAVSIEAKGDAKPDKATDKKAAKADAALVKTAPAPSAAPTK